MKFEKLLLGAIAGCIAFASPASAQILSVVNICEVKPDGSVHTVKVIAAGARNYTHYFKNMTTLQTFVLTGTGLVQSRTFALNPGTYILKYSEPVGINPVQVTYPNTIVVRPYTLTGAQGTGCVLNAPPKIGDKAQRVPKTPLPQ